MNPSEQSPRYEIASVVFMDIVSYSLRSIDDQTELLTILQRAVRESSEYRQGTAKRELISLPAGDGMALVFLRDPVSPIKCALEIAASLKDHPEIKLRIGIHQGPVRHHADIKEDANVVGGGINMAQRVMDFGDAGHILLSRNVAEVLDQLGGWSGCLQDLGIHEVKHGAKVHLFNLYKDGLGNPALPRKAGATDTAGDRASSGRQRRTSRKRIQSLAVLPLTNLSGDPEQDYFADGMTDALITTLAQIGALRIISRTSVMRYKGTRQALPDIARELNVEVVLEGTVLRSESRVRISTQLIDAPTDTHLWARNYESDLRDILAVQSEVAQAVAQEIKITLTPQERARFSATRPVDPEAYEAFLKGRHYWYKRSPEALHKSLECLQRALAKDPTYALAQAGVADTYVSLGWDLFAAVPPVEAFPEAKRAVQKALELDPNCAEAHAAFGWTAGAYDWDWVTAERELRRALDLKPQYGPAHIWYSHLLHAMGRTDESFEEGQRAIACDPLGLILNVHLGWHHVYEREYERAIAQLHKALELDPDFILARMFLGEAYEQLGRFGEAIAEFEKAVSLSGRHPVYLAGLGHAYAVSGQTDNALKTIQELQQVSSHRYVPARGVAEIYIGLGQKDEAFAWLDTALQQRNGWLLHVRSNPRYDSLRSDPRYTDMVRRIGLP